MAVDCGTTLVTHTLLTRLLFRLYPIRRLLLFASLIGGRRSSCIITRTSRIRQVSAISVYMVYLHRSHNSSQATPKVVVILLPSTSFPRPTRHLISSFAVPLIGTDGVTTINHIVGDLRMPPPSPSLRHSKCEPSASGTPPPPPTPLQSVLTASQVISGACVAGSRVRTATRHLPVSFDSAPCVCCASVSPNLSNDYLQSSRKVMGKALGTLCV